MVCFTWRLFLRLFVCLSVHLLATWSDLYENFIEGASVNKKELIKFGSYPHLDTGLRIFLKHSSTLWDREFFLILAYISWKTDQMCMKIISEM